jgi:DNA primase catalytic core
MARIPDSELERLKNEVSVQRLAEARGIQLKRHGADLVGLCPFHDDRNPSLVISPAKNLWHCLGACQAGGSVVDWVMKAEGVSFRHAVEILRADLPLAGPLRAVKTSSVRKLPPPVSAEADERAALVQVVDYYHATLKQSPEALAYLEGRGLKSAEMIERFRLGYANRTLGLRLPMKAWKAGGELRGRLARLGVIRESGHEHFNGSIVIPVFGEDGGVTEMYGRKVTPNLRPGTPLHLYLPGPHRGVWNWQALAASPAVILCEALIDALTFWCAGYRNVTSAYGVEGFTAEHLDAFKRHGVGQVLIAFDRDEAGDKGAEKVARQLVEMGLECYRVQFPRGMDANEYAKKTTPASKALELVLRSAAWMGKGPARTAGELVTAKREAVVVNTRGEVVTQPEAAPAPEVAAPWAAPMLAESEAAAEVPAPAVAVVATPAAPMTPAPAAAEHPSLAAPLPAAPAPAASAPPVLPSAPATPEVPCEVTADEVRFVFGDRRYRVRGLGRATSYDALKVNLLAACGERFHVDTFDVYAARQRAIYLKQAATELGVEEDVVKSDLGKVLLKLEQLQDAQIREAMAPKETTVEVGEAERAAALELLKAPNLLDRILDDFCKSGVVGEETNKLVGYLAAVSRKLEDPLAVIHPVVVGGREVVADGGGAGLHARGRSREVRGDDGAVALLHGRDEPQAQDPGDRRGGRRGPRFVRAEDLAERRRADDRLDGQGSGDGQAHHARVPGGGAGDDLSDDDGDRDRRGADEPLHRAVGRRGSGADAGDPPHPTGAADAGRPARTRGEARGAQGAPGRAAPAAPAARREPLRSAAHFLG